jgi:glyoxylase-like metal-dependent hydrolase (beta-lactamase superfamily II)
MNVVPLTVPSAVYNCRPYLVLGTWNRIEDVNAIIDPGADAAVVAQVEQASTGVGKRPVEVVVLTHNHFDHAAAAGAIKDRFGAKVLAWAPGHGVDETLRDGQLLRLGDGLFEVIHLPVHSDDSICLYCAQEGILFSGDTALRILNPEGTYSLAFVHFLERLVGLPLRHIYGGHDPPWENNIAEILRTTLEMVRRAHILVTPMP